VIREAAWKEKLTFLRPPITINAKRYMKKN
jgi:hypothetical protein